MNSLLVVLGVFLFTGVFSPSAYALDPGAFTCKFEHPLSEGEMCRSYRDQKGEVVTLLGLNAGRCNGVQFDFDTRKGTMSLYALYDGKKIGQGTRTKTRLMIREFQGNTVLSYFPAHVQNLSPFMIQLTNSKIDGLVGQLSWMDSYNGNRQFGPYYMNCVRKN